ITQTGGTNFTYNAILYYTPATINTIPYESGIGVMKGDASTWNPVAVSGVDTIAHTASAGGLSSLSLFALTDRGIVPPLAVNAKVFLQGPYSTGTSAMLATLNAAAKLPLTSETAYPAATFGYTARTVTSIPNTSIVDWVLVELRTGTAPGTKIATQAAFLKTDGTIVDLDGTSLLNFNGIAVGSYYLIIRHRNHLSIMSAAPVPLSGASTLYDFSTAQTQAYGVSPMRNLSGGTVFGMYAGNNDGDAIIQTHDYVAVALDLFTSGYFLYDHDMNGLIDVDDYNPVGLNLFISSQVP
ncbi:MAG TPA: hypothetical protein VK470_13810, partial [Bacteroidota bacterium]|nr:hypothetical protein [Bacteroidota bacterium]